MIINALDDLVGRVSSRCVSTQPGPYHNCCNCVGFHNPDRGLVVDSVILCLRDDEAKCLCNALWSDGVIVLRRQRFVVENSVKRSRTRSIIKTLNEMTPERYRYIRAIISITVVQPG